jgi:hypothetical protein
VIELILIAVVVGLAVLGGRVHGGHRDRLDDLEAVDRAARADQAAERAELARQRDDVAARITAVEQREDECAKLAQSTAEQREALFKMTKGLNRSVAQWAHESHAEAQAVLREAGLVRDEARQQNEKVSAIVNDERVKRYLRTGR